VTDNTTRQNPGHGIALLGNTTATLSGGRITQNGFHEISLDDEATAIIGLEDAAELVVSHNFAAGMFVTDNGASAQINSGHIRFEVNGTGTWFGPVTDVLVDADGLDDADEATQGTDPHRDDTDGDGLRDRFETRYGFNPWTRAMASALTRTAMG
jgi:hypothetical protein